MKRFLIGLSACAAVLAAPIAMELPVWAQVQRLGGTIAQNLQAEENPIVMQLAVEKKVVELDAQGEPVTQWQVLSGEQTQVQPGDVLRYWLDIQNISDRPVEDLVIAQPIPANTVFVLNSVVADEAVAVTYSIDGGSQFVAEPMIEVTLADGSVEMQPAPADAYTHISWDFGDAEPETELTANYQVEVR